jgi:ribosomal protein L32
MNLFTPAKHVIGSFDGIDSNAFSLIGHFRKLARNSKWSAEDIDRVVEEAKKSTHDHLVYVLLTHTNETPSQESPSKAVVVKHVSEERYEELTTQFDALFQEKVIVGFTNTVSPTHFGEICRALGRVQYRLFNDGDKCFVGYGCETCGGQATFLKYNVNDAVKEHFIKFEKAGFFDCESSYMQWFQDLMGLVMEHMQTTPDKPTELDMNTVESEWNHQVCAHCGYRFEKDEINGNGNCDDCQEELDEEEDDE